MCIVWMVGLQHQTFQLYKSTSTVLYYLPMWTDLNCWCGFSEPCSWKPEDTEQLLPIYMTEQKSVDEAISYLNGVENGVGILTARV